MIFSQLVTEAQRMAGRVDTTYDDRTKQWINEALEQWSIADPWRMLTKEDVFLADGSEDLILPQYVRKIISIYDKTNSTQVKRHGNWDREDTAAQAPVTAGTAFWWDELGFSPVTDQPTTATQLTFDPVGVENIVCYVRGVVQGTEASGTAVQFHDESEFVTCVTGAATDTSREFVKILQLGKTTLTSSDVIVSLKGGADISRLELDSYDVKYRHVRFNRKPTAGTEYTIRYLLRVAEFTQDNQIVPPGVDARFLVWWAASNIHGSMGQEAEARIKRDMALALLERKSHHEQSHGDQDWRMSPDDEYWTSEDRYGWPP